MDLYTIASNCVVEAESAEEAVQLVKDLLVYKNGAEWLEVKHKQHVFRGDGTDTCVVCGCDLRHADHERVAS